MLRCLTCKRYRSAADRQDFNYPRVPDCGVWHKNTICVGFEGKEYNAQTLEGKIIEKIRKDMKEMIEEPIIEVIAEDEIMFLKRIQKNLFLGFFYTCEGNLANRSALTIQEKTVKKILATVKHLVVLANDSDVIVYHKHDMMPIMKINIPDEKKSLSLSNSISEIFIASSNKVYYFELQTSEAQINECVKRGKTKEALSVFEVYYPKSSKIEKRDAMLKNIYYKLGYALT